MSQGFYVIAILTFPYHWLPVPYGGDGNKTSDLQHKSLLKSHEKHCILKFWSEKDRVVLRWIITNSF